MSQDAKSYFKEHGWKWVFIEEPKPVIPPRQKHWKYGAVKIIAPSLYADLYGKTKEVYV